MNFSQRLDYMKILTTGEGFTDITSKINSWVNNTKIKRGIINITSLHTSCSLTINENADPRVLKDLSTYFKTIVPELGVYSSNKNKQIQYTHNDEGIDDMPAHIKTALTSTCLSLSIDKGNILLGTWQAIYLWEHRYNEHLRNICIHAIGEEVATN